MKKNKLFLVLVLLVLSACVTNDYWKLKIEIPRKIEVDLEQYDNIVITPFLVTEEAEGFDLNKEIVKYFVAELTRKAKTTISTMDTGVAENDLFESSDYWKSLEPDSEGKLFITGSAQYSTEIRKALIKKEKKRYEDPFPNPAKLEQRKFYTLNLDLYLIDAKTGTPVYQREFKETKAYTNPNQTGYYAFFDLILQVKDKLFRSVLGEKRLEERYLIIREKE